MTSRAGASATDRLRAVTRRPRAAALACALLAAVAYLNALGNGFAYDDVHIIQENEAIQSLETLPGALARPYWPGDHGRELGLWRPLTTGLLGIEYALWGESPAPYHLVNVALHGAATFLAVLVLAELMPVLAALVGGLLFAVHPVHVEAVANVIGMAELLPAVLYLAALLVALRSWRPETPQTGSRPWMSVFAVAGLYACAFLTKESAVTLPAVILLADGARRSLRIRELGAYLRRRGPLYLVLAVTAALILALRLRVLGTVADPDAALGASLLEEVPRIWTLGGVWTHYLRLLLVPLELSADYAPDVIPVLTVWTAESALGVGAVLGALALALVSWRAPGLRPDRSSARTLGFGVVWFVVTILPVSNVVFLSGVLLAERTLYLPSFGLAAVAGWALVRLVERRRTAGWSLVAILVLFSGIRTWTRTPVWRSTETVFASMIEERPESGRSQWVLGDILYSQGRIAEARRAYRRAVGLLDGSYRLLMEVGWDAVEDGDTRLGEFLLLQAWEKEPELPSAPRRLAILYSRTGRWAEAERFARLAVERVPEDVATWHLLAGALTANSKWEEALAARRRVLALGEDEHWQQWLSLANLHLTLGDSARARVALDSAVARADSAPLARQIREAFRPLDVPVPVP